PPPAHRRPARRPGPRAVAPPLDAAAVRQLRPLRGAETAERAAEAGVMINPGGGGPGGRPPEGPDVPRAAGPRRPGDPMVGTPPPVGQTSVILPTYNEGLVIVDVVREILEAVGDVEVLVVDDDSPDRTWQVVENGFRGDGRVRVLRRIGRRGLPSALAEGVAE